MENNGSVSISVNWTCPKCGRIYYKWNEIHKCYRCGFQEFRVLTSPIIKETPTLEPQKKSPFYLDIIQ